MVQLNSLFDSQIANQPSVTADAASLLALWRRLENSHLPVSFGCSCGGPGHVRARDFEHDVLDYLREKHEKTEAVSAVLQRLVGQIDGPNNSISALLQGIAADEDFNNENANSQILADLRRSLSSWSGALKPADSIPIR